MTLTNTQLDALVAVPARIYVEPAEELALEHAGLVEAVPGEPYAQLTDVGRAIYEALPELEVAVREHAGLLETTPTDEVLRYLREGNLNAALECVGQAASLQESCMNQGRADSLHTLADRIGREGANFPADVKTPEASLYVARTESGSLVSAYGTEEVAHDRAAAVADETVVALRPMTAAEIDRYVSDGALPDVEAADTPTPTPTLGVELRDRLADFDTTIGVTRDGTRLLVGVNVEKDADGVPFVQLVGVNCNLEGEEPGRYYPVARA